MRPDRSWRMGRDAVIERGVRYTRKATEADFAWLGGVAYVMMLYIPFPCVLAALGRYLNGGGRRAPSRMAPPRLPFVAEHR